MTARVAAGDKGIDSSENLDSRFNASTYAPRIPWQFYSPDATPKYSKLGRLGGGAGEAGGASFSGTADGTHQKIPREILQAQFTQEGVAYAIPEAEEIINAITRAEHLAGTYQGSCVDAVEAFLGLPEDKIVGAARNYQTNTTTPTIGAIVKTNESDLGHLGVVLYITKTQIYIYESNAIDIDGDRQPDGIAGIRWLNIDDPVIQGYG